MELSDPLCRLRGRAQEEELNELLEVLGPRVQFLALSTEYHPALSTLEITQKLVL